MATYEEIAPIISGTGITQAQVVNYFENIPEPPEPVPDPVITSQKVAALANIYFEPFGVEKRNGLLKVAHIVGLTVAQCQAIIAEIQALKAVWDAMNQPPGE